MRFLLSILAAIIASCSSDSGRTLVRPDVTLDYVVLGDGPPLYLLHGGMESRDSFAGQFPFLTEHFTVVALDNREQGRSSNSETQISYEVMVQDVAALAEHLNHDKISIIGHSDGGVVALTIAIRYPGLVDKLVLMETVYHFEAYPAETRSFIAEYEWDGNEDPTLFPGMFIEHYLKGQNDLSGFSATLREMAILWTTSPTFSKADLAAVQASALIINGDREDINLEHINSLRASIPDAKLHIVTGAAHYPHQEKPALFNNVVLDFLNR